jgi:hypothetical protein
MSDLIMIRYEHIYVDFIILVYNSFFLNKIKIIVCYLFQLDGDNQLLLARPPLEQSRS